MSQFEHKFLVKTLFHQLGQFLLSFTEKIAGRLCLGRTNRLLHTITLLMCLKDGGGCGGGCHGRGQLGHGVGKGGQILGHTSLETSYIAHITIEVNTLESIAWTWCEHQPRLIQPMQL